MYIRSNEIMHVCATAVLPPCLTDKMLLIISSDVTALLEVGGYRSCRRAGTELNPLTLEAPC